MSLVLRFCLFVMMVVFSVNPAFAAEHGGGGEKKEAAKEEESGGINDVASIWGGGEGGPVYVRMKPVVLPVISDKGAEQLVNIIVDLQTKDYDVATNLNANKPKLNDAIIRALYGGLADGSMRNAYALDIMKVKGNIRDTINETFGEGTILEVLVQAVEQRRL